MNNYSQICLKKGISVKFLRGKPTENFSGTRFQTLQHLLSRQASGYLPYRE